MGEKVTKGKSTKYIIHSTMEVFLKEINKCGDGKAYFLGLTTEANVSKEITQEPIKAGISNDEIAVLQANDGMSVAVTTGVHYQENMEIQTGNVFEDGEVTIKEIEEHADGTFTATDKVVTGNVMDLSTENLPRNYEIQLRGIAYDPTTGRSVADIYWLFDQATPDGNLEEVFTNGTNKTQNINFRIQVPQGKKSYGKYVAVKIEHEDEVCELVEED